MDRWDWAFLCVLFFAAIVAAGAGLESAYAEQDAHAVEAPR